MKNTVKNSPLKWQWVSALILVFTIAFMAGCYNANDDDDNEAVLTQAGTDAERGADEWDDEFCCHNPDLGDLEMVVATVNGIDITAFDVMMELSWAVQILQMEYIVMFPDDTEFNFDRPFRDEYTFGRVLLEEAAIMAAHVKLYYDFALRHNIEWIEDGFQHPVMEVVYAIINDPELFAQFESYMPEDTSAIAIEKAEELLERVLAGENFSYLVETYGEDPGMERYPRGYTFARGDMVPQFENATLELEIGEISGLVMTDFGIHIIKRVEPDPDNIMQGSPAGLDPDFPEEDLLGAMHILIMANFSSPEEMMFEAVFIAFEGKWETSNIEFLETLDDIPLG